MSDNEERGWRHKHWSERSMAARMKIVGAGLVLVPALFALFAAVTMWLWNWLMPELFKLPEIGFWQAVGILVLSRILFRGGGGHRMGRHRWNRARIQDKMAD